MHSRPTTTKPQSSPTKYQHLKDHAGIKDIKKFWTNHTKAIKKFSRYPHRNKALGRKSTLEEIEFLKQPNSSW